MNILQAIDDPALFAPWFKDARTWATWRVFLAALFGLPMTADQLATYRQLTGRADVPSDEIGETWLVCGRRAGKSFILAVVAVYLACFRDYRPYLQPGERGTVIVIASDRRQARTIFRYARALLTRIPMLAKMIERSAAETFDLTNSVSIEIGTASFRTSRGYTIVAALCDEIAFWHSDDSANPDVEILDALRPGMATIPTSMLLCASSPYAKRGALHNAFRRHYGRPGPVLVWKAPTRVMNPSVPQRIVNAAIERDPAAAASEWLAEFRNDISAFVPREVIQSCVDAGERERPFDSKHQYVAFVDPSGGSSDSMTLAIGHRENEITVVDVVREIPAPFDPESATDEFVKLLREYRLTQVTGDRYAGQWTAQAFQKRGIDYRHSDLPKSGLYIDLLPKLNSRTIRLVDNQRLINQLAGLERKTARGGKDSIDHGPGAHDDLANVIAGLAHCAVNRSSITINELRI